MCTYMWVNPIHCDDRPQILAILSFFDPILAYGIAKKILSTAEHLYLPGTGRFDPRIPIGTPKRSTIPQATEVHLTPRPPRE